MDKKRNTKTLGLIFLAAGVTVLALGLAKRQTVYWAMVPALNYTWRWIFDETTTSSTTSKGGLT